MPHGHMLHGGNWKIAYLKVFQDVSFAPQQWAPKTQGCEWPRPDSVKSWCVLA